MHIEIMAAQAFIEWWQRAKAGGSGKRTFRMNGKELDFDAPEVPALVESAKSVLRKYAPSHYSRLFPDETSEIV